MEELNKIEELKIDDLYSKIVDSIETAKRKVAVQLNNEMTVLYWRIGKDITDTVLNNQKAEYGKAVIDELSKKLVIEYGRGYGRANLFRMIKIYEYFQDFEIFSTLSRKLSWSHFVELLHKKYDQKGMNEFVTNPDESSIVFDNSDLYFALHKSDMCITGKKKNDKWDLVVELSDQYDYTDFKELDDYYNDANSVPKSMFSSFIYNLAFFSVKFGVIKEYHINIKFNIDNYEVN